MNQDKDNLRKILFCIIELKLFFLLKLNLSGSLMIKKNIEIPKNPDMIAKIVIEVSIGTDPSKINGSETDVIRPKRIKNSLDALSLVLP